MRLHPSKSVAASGNACPLAVGPDPGVFGALAMHVVLMVLPRNVRGKISHDFAPAGAHMSGGSEKYKECGML